MATESFIILQNETIKQMSKDNYAHKYERLVRLSLHRKETAEFLKRYEEIDFICTNDFFQKIIDDNKKRVKDLKIGKKTFDITNEIVINIQIVFDNIDKAIIDAELEKIAFLKECYAEGEDNSLGL
jgi:hypothetical protein